MTDNQLVFLGYLSKQDFSSPEPQISPEEEKELEDLGLIIWYDGYGITWDGDLVYYLLRQYCKEKI